MKGFLSALVCIVFALASYLARADLLVPIAETPKKTTFVLREIISFNPARNFTLLNEFSEHTEDEATEALYPSTQVIGNSLVSFLSYEDGINRLLWKDHFSCLTEVTARWSKKLEKQPEELFYRLNVHDWSTVAIVDLATNDTFITPNKCEIPSFSYAALVLKKSVEGVVHQLAAGDQLTVNRVRVDRHEFSYRISIGFSGHEFVKSLDIITSSLPEDMDLRQLSFSAPRSYEHRPAGKVFQIETPKQKYF